MTAAHQRRDDPPSGGLVVVGSANIDRIVVVERFPRPGETVIGAPVEVRQGGKGANQAVAAARMGADVTFIGHVGDDDDGGRLVADLVAADIDVTPVSRVPGSSGSAFICVDVRAENTIVVSPGANATVSASTVQRHRQRLSGAETVLAQLEIPLDAVQAALRTAGGRSILNPAPAGRLPTELLELADVIVPNRGELGVLAGGDTPETPDDVVDMARELPVDNVVVTLGQQGAVVIQRCAVTTIPAIDVTPVDTTGAGDAFCGALAARLCHGDDLVTAATTAVTAAGLSTTSLGARDGLPTLAAVTATGPRQVGDVETSRGG